MPAPPVPNVLLIEAEAATAYAVRSALQDHFHADCVRHCPNVALALQCDVTTTDIVLTCMHLPDGTGLNLLERLLARRPDLPIVIVTSLSSIDTALQAIHSGAYDYVAKVGDWMAVLPLIVEKNLALWRTRQENLRLQLQLTHTAEELQIKNRQLEEAVDKLKAMALTDGLTGLANRRAFNQALEQSFQQCSRYGHDLACIMIDVDGFKTYNDTHGHQQGDNLLQLLGRVLQANCRGSDLAGRYGGDEFVLLLPETDLATARLVAKRISDQWAISCGGLRTCITGPPGRTLSMGLACLTQSHPADPDQLLAQADQALYRAKQLGKACLVVHAPPAPVTV